MKNYKQALFDAISDSTNAARENLNGYSQDFITDNDAGSSQYICDNFDKVEEAISEFGWDGCGSDLYKAGQMAEFMSIEREINEEIEDIIKYITLDFIDSTDEANDDAEKIWQTLTEEQKSELLTAFIDDLEMIDNNSRFDEIADLYNDFVQSILDIEEHDGAKG